MPRATVISGTRDSDYAFRKAAIGAGDTSFHTLFSAITSRCFGLRWRTTVGTTIQRDGRLRRRLACPPDQDLASATRAVTGEIELGQSRGVAPGS